MRSFVRHHRARHWLSLLGCALALGSWDLARADIAVVSETRFLPGDAEPGTPVEEQDWARIAAGGPGYLAVWQDVRSVLSGWVNTAYNPLTGNQTDIYATRMDTEGNVIDSCPIVIANEGRNQESPKVAWNGDSWLVVYKSERPDWYFFTDILARRVSANGEVLDTDPIEIRLENNDPANDHGDYPSVISDGTNWIVVWQDITWQENGVGWPNISGVRIAPDGTILDATPRILYQHPTYSFGPNTPDIAFNGEIFLLAWERLGASYGRRLDANLDPIDASPFQIGGGSYFLRVESNGQDFLLGSRDHRKVYRITADGAVLDPSGLAIPLPGGYQYRGPDIAWDGTDWIMVISGDPAVNGGPDIWQARLHPDGTFGDVSAIAPDTEDQYKPAVASRGNGTSQVVWSSRRVSELVLENIEGATLGPNGTTGPEVLVSLGLGRQSQVRFGTDGTYHVAVYQSEGNGESRILAQRIDSAGQALDAEPVILGTVPESRFPSPDVAWNGTHYLVTWTLNGAVYGRRLTADLTPVDPTPVVLFSDAAGETGVAALGTDFFVAYPHTFSGDQRNLKGVRISGADLSVVGSLLNIGGGFALNPVARTVGNRVFVVWEQQVTHDNNASTVRSVWIEENGGLGGAAIVSVSGDSDYPGVAVGVDRMLVTWHDEISTTDTSVEGRMLALDGTPLTGELLICNEPKEQMFPACGWSGTFFTVAWADMRGLGQVDQLRGDIYTTRVAIDGTVLDPGGIQVTSGPLPEDLPAVGGCGDVCVIAFSQMHGACGNPEVQRIGYVTVQELSPASVDERDPGRFRLLAGPNPFEENVKISWSGAKSGLHLAAGERAEVEVEIYSTSGRRVWSAPLQTASGSLNWDGLSLSGRPVPNGTYFVRLRSGRKELGAARIIRVR